MIRIMLVGREAYSCDMDVLCTHTIQNLIFLHLFTDLFHKDLSSLNGINCRYFGMNCNLFLRLRVLEIGPK